MESSRLSSSLVRALVQLHAALFCLCLCVGHVTAQAPSEAVATDGGGHAPVRLRLDAELGFLAPLAHSVRFSRAGARIDYVEEGGQDVLFPFARLSTQLELHGRHLITLLYQPLQLEGTVRAQRDLLVDDVTFPEGTPMRFGYGFPFWRLSYAYLVVDEAEWKLALGAGLQIRNATITFESLDGQRLVSNRDVGPVPLLRAYMRGNLDTQWFIEGEVDGFYAPVKYLNGGKSDVVGAIVDLNARLGLAITRRLEAFINVRYLGGGAEGTGEPDGGGDGYTKNWLHFLTVSLGARAYVM